MPVNLDKPHNWKQDIVQSVDLYNSWFLQFAPKTYRDERARATQHVEAMLQRTSYLRTLSSVELTNDPPILFALRMTTAPPIARDRLAGLAHVPKTFIESMEKDGRLPPRMVAKRLEANLSKIVSMIKQLADVDIFPWLEENREPTQQEVYRAATIVADRLCGANANPIVRNAQEKRQLAKIKHWLEERKYQDVTGKTTLANLKPGTFAFRLNVPGMKEDGEGVNIPVDAVVKPVTAQPADFPLLVEAKSAGDFTNTNKRRKEEATKVGQLRRKYGSEVRYVLFLCGYFDSGYLGYEAAEGIDWVWEHRMDDLTGFGL